MINLKQIIESNSWSDFEKSLSFLGKKEKGNLFEEFTRLFLLTNPVYGSRIENIWIHKDIPTVKLKNIIFF